MEKMDGKVWDAEIVLDIAHLFEFWFDDPVYILIVAHGKLWFSSRARLHPQRSGTISSADPLHSYGVLSPS
jgi:hypothetical protein